MFLFCSVTKLEEALYTHSGGLRAVQSSKQQLYTRSITAEHSQAPECSLNSILLPLPAPEQPDGRTTALISAGHSLLACSEAPAEIPCQHTRWHSLQDKIQKVHLGDCTWG